MRVDLDRIRRDPQLIAQSAWADDVFSFLTRQVTVPATCVGLVFGDAIQPRVVPAGRTIESDNVRELIFARTDPVELEYEFEGLPSKDGYPFTARVTLSVRLVPERIELEAFRRNVLGSQRVVRQERLKQHCEQAVRGAAAAFAREHDASVLLSPQRWNEFDAMLQQHFAPVGFESGLAMGPDPDVVFESDAFEEHQREQKVTALRREREQRDHESREAAAKARQEHLTELAGLVEKVRSMADAAGNLSVPELIKTFSSGQRGQLYRGLMAAREPARPTKSILVVAGSDLLRFDPKHLGQPVRRQELPAKAGALRSVRLSEHGEKPLILVGARHGVHLIDDSADSIETFVFEERADLRGGVNAAAILGGGIYATHSEVGLVEWKRQTPDQHRLCLTDLTEGSKSVRDVQTDHLGRLWLSVDNIVIGWRPGEETPGTVAQAPTEVTVLIVAEGYVVAGLRDGSVVRWLIGDFERMETVRASTGEAVRSLAWMSGGGVARVLVGDNRPHLDLHVIGDSFHGEYRCYHKLRWGHAGEDLIVGVNDRRDHIFCWRVDEPEQPCGSVAVGRMTGRSIQDVAVVC